MKNHSKRILYHLISLLLFLILCGCLALSACVRLKEQEQDPAILFPPSATDPSKELQTDGTQVPPLSENLTPVTHERIYLVGNRRAICLDDQYQGKRCESVVISVSTLSYQSHDLLRLYFSQSNNQLIGLRVLGRDITSMEDENGTLFYCLDMQALGVDVKGYGDGWEDLWVQFFFSPGSLKKNQAYPIMVEAHYEGDCYRREVKRVFDECGLREDLELVSSSRVYASLSQLYEQTNVKDLHLPASVVCMQVECRNEGDWLQYDPADNQGTIFIQQVSEGYLKQEMDRYKDFYSERVIHEEDGITYYIIGSWATCGAPPIPDSYSIYWQIGTTYYQWYLFNLTSFEQAIALTEDLKTFPTTP